MRGDRPKRGVSSNTGSVFTPHARGSTLTLRGLTRIIHVYPACAGIDRSALNFLTMTSGLPRMRGDRPSSNVSGKGISLFTPHARGSTPPIAVRTSQAQVYPACAGIDLR